MNTFIIFSPSEGFWQSNLGWSYCPNEADTLSEIDKEYYERNPRCLPGTQLSDVIIVPKENYSHLNYEEVTDRVIEVLSGFGGDVLKQFSDKYAKKKLTYLGDSLFRDSQKEIVGFGEVLESIKGQLEDLSNEALGDIYNEIQSNKVYPDGFEGFYHQLIR